MTRLPILAAALVGIVACKSNRGTARLAEADAAEAVDDAGLSGGNPEWAFVAPSSFADFDGGPTAGSGDADASAGSYGADASGGYGADASGRDGGGYGSDTTGIDYAEIGRVIEGDMILDDGFDAAGLGLSAFGNVRTWPSGVILFSVDPAMEGRERFTDAMAHWESQTGIRFRQATASDRAYLRVTSRGPGCWAHLGYTGEVQTLNLAPGSCTTGNAIHEIGHTLGFEHEQTRTDRDQWVRINFENIVEKAPGGQSGREQFVSRSQPVGAYDYGSIMHYGRDFFSKNGQPTIVPVQEGVEIGQRRGLSAGDLEAVRQKYGL